jgi:hypothetical protein
MVIILEPHTIPEKGKVELKVDRSFEIKVTAEEARRQVRRWLRDEVSLLIDADLPTLVVGDQVVWRVSAWIGFPHTGRAGIVGTIDVDVTTGSMNNTPECKTEIEHQAEAVAAWQPPYRPKDNVPEQYLAKNVPPAPKLHILEDGTLAPLPPTKKDPA